MNTLLTSPRRLVLALVAADALGATGAGLVTGLHTSAGAQPAPAVALLAPTARAAIAAPDFSDIVAANGPASTAGVQAGDVLLTINGTPAASIDQVRAVVPKAGKSVALLIERDGNKIFVPVRLG